MEVIDKKQRKRRDIICYNTKINYKKQEISEKHEI